MGSHFQMTLFCSMQILQEDSTAAASHKPTDVDCPIDEEIDASMLVDFHPADQEDLPATCHRGTQFSSKPYRKSRGMYYNGTSGFRSPTGVAKSDLNYEVILILRLVYI